MPIYHHDVEQYSAQYDKLKLGMPTSSNFKRIITAGGERSKQRTAYMNYLLAERALNRKLETYTDPNMQRGLDLQPNAISWYMYETGREVKPIGFVTNDERTVGSSPDGLVGDEGFLEVKIPKEHTQIGYVMFMLRVALGFETSGDYGLDDYYRPQHQGQLYVGKDRKWVDIVPWHPEIPKIIIRVERNDVYQAKLDKELKAFNHELETLWLAIKTAMEGTPLSAISEKLRTEGLRAALKASLAHEESKDPPYDPETGEILSEHPGPALIPEQPSTQEPAGAPGALGRMRRPVKPEPRLSAALKTLGYPEPALPSGQEAVGGGGDAEEPPPPKQSAGSQTPGVPPAVGKPSLVPQGSPLFAPQGARIETPSFWETTKDYVPIVDDADIKGKGCEQLIALVKTAPSLEAILAFRDANLFRMDRMGLTARQAFVRAMTGRKAELGE